MAFKKTLCALAAGIMLFTGCEKYRQAEEDYRRNELALFQEIKRTSPFVQTPVSAPLEEKERDKKWYQEHTFAPLNNDIVYENEWGSLCIAKDKDERKSTKILNNPRIYEKYLFTVDLEGKGNPDIYFIDNTFNHNLIRLINKDGKFKEGEILFPLRDYFQQGIPEHLEIGDINSDGLIDIIYGGRVEFSTLFHGNVIKAFKGNKKGKLDDAGPVFYLGDDNLEGLISRDVDNDGDSDLIFKLKGNKKELFGLENKTKKGSNPIVFQDGFRDKIKNEDSTMMDLFLIYFIFFQPGGLLNSFDDD